MGAAQFPASAANSLIEGYCDDFVSLAAVLAQTLEQVSMRGIAIDKSRESLERIERGMRDLAEAIQGLLAGDAAPEPPAESMASAPRDPKATGRSAPDVPTAPRVPLFRPEDAEPPAPKLQPEDAEPPAPKPRPDEPGPIAPSLRFDLPEPPPMVKAPVRGAARPRRPLTQQPEEPRAASLKGNNQSMPLLSVCQFLGRMHKNGIMHVTILDEKVTFEFVNGSVQHTTSTGCPPKERTGEILVAMGFCSESALAPVLARAQKSNEPLGDLILKAGLVSHGQLLEALERQVQMRFARACQTLLASYEFEEGVCTPTDGRVHVTPFELAWQLKQQRR